MYHQSVNYDSDIFSKVIDSEKRRLFKDVANSRVEIISKGESDQIYRFVAERTSPRQELVCSIPFGIPQPKNEKVLICNFFVGGERYFFSTPATVENDTVLLSTDGDLFHLQRRQNYRIKIPENYTADFLITEHKNSPIKLKGHIYDLSSGGCRVEVTASTPVITIGDPVVGHISIDKREPLEVEGIVRHYKLEKFASKPPKQIFGVEYANMTPFLEGKLFAITMDLHREFFSRLNSNS